MLLQILLLKVLESTCFSPNELDGTLGLDSPDGVDRAVTQQYQTSPTAGTKENAVVKVRKLISFEWPCQRGLTVATFARASVCGQC